MSVKEDSLERGITETKTNRLLVICVDRDDDIGKKAGVATPVVGRNACIDAAQRLALEDGEDDESVIPIIQNVLPIVSVRRVVMRVSRSVEYSYAVLGRYLRAIVFDARYSKFFLGVPGILLVIGGIASIFGITKEISAILLSILGGAFLIRAFDVDRTWSQWIKPTPAGFIRIFTLVAGALLMLVSIPTGITAVNPSLVQAQPDVLSIVT